MEKERVGIELRSLNNLIRRYFDNSSHKKEIARVTGNNNWIIGYLADHADRDIFQKDIEERFTITSSTTSRVLGLMEQKGLIRRLPVIQDARLKKIILTEEAIKLSRVMREDGEAMERTLLQGFTPEETELLRSYLKRMKNNIAASQADERGDMHV